MSCSDIFYRPEQEAKVITPTQQILKDCIELMERKSSDYDSDSETDGLGNFRTVVDFGVVPSIGAMCRLNDKFERIKNLLKKESRGEGPAVKDETIEDTLMDLINYGAIVLALRREERKNAS